MRRLQSLMLELDEKKREKVQKIMKGALYKVDCADVDVYSFWIKKNSEERIRKFLEKEIVQFFTAVAICVKEEDKDCKRVIVSCQNAFDEASDIVVYTKKQKSISVRILLSKKSLIK